MIFKMPKVSFYLRPNRDKTTTKTLFCRVTHNLTKTEFSLQEKINPKDWCQKSYRLKNDSAQARYVDLLINKAKYNLNTFAIMNEEVRTAKELVQLYKSKSVAEPLVVDLIQNYIDHVSGEISAGTLKHHNIKKNNLEDYQKATKQKLHPSSFSLPAAEKFKEWFMKRANTTKVTTASRNISFYQKALNFAVKKGTIKSHELLNYSSETDKTDKTVFLTLKEVKRLEKLKPVNGQLRRILDLFLFQCYTGLSYGDLWGDWKIKKSKAGNIICGTRTKNGQSFYIPLSNEAKEILLKYQTEMPKYANATFNRILKELAMLSNIDKRITTHTGRKTFATIQDSLGWTRESVSKMLGHKYTKTTESYYLGDTMQRIEQEMLARV